MNNLISKTVLIILSVIVSASCSRREDLSFNDWDKDNDNLINKTEFIDVFSSNYYDDWDQNDNAYLDDEDFLTSTFRVWDEDENEYIEEEEWVVGFDYMYGDYIIDDYEAIDTDNDGYIEYLEYEAALAPSTFYFDWDFNSDGEVDAEELAMGIFDIWDKDNSQYIEPDEYAEFDSYYLEF